MSLSSPLLKPTRTSSPPAQHHHVTFAVGTDDNKVVARAAVDHSLRIRAVIALERIAGGIRGELGIVPVVGSDAAGGNLAVRVPDAEGDFKISRSHLPVDERLDNQAVARAVLGGKQIAEDRIIFNRPDDGLIDGIGGNRRSVHAIDVDSRFKALEGHRHLQRGPLGHVHVELALSGRQIVVHRRALETSDAYLRASGVEYPHGVIRAGIQLPLILAGEEFLLVDVDHVIARACADNRGTVGVGAAHAFRVAVEPHGIVAFTSADGHVLQPFLAGALGCR